MASLPPELWLMILNLVKDSIIDQYEGCYNEAFPMLDLQLRDPRYHSSIKEVIIQLRLVCRSFKAIVGSSPQCFMTYEHSLIPSRTRVLVITQYQGSSAYLLRVLQDRSIARHILALHLPCDVSVASEQSDFSFLCRHARFLPNIRSLALNLWPAGRNTRISRFWERINDAFPFLICLALLFEIQRGWEVCHFSDSTHPVVTFKYLEVLVLDNLPLAYIIGLPVIRHVSMGNCAPSELHKLHQSPHLESLLVRGRGLTHTNNPASLLPRGLRLLGIPYTSKGGGYPVPKNCPLNHLWVFFDSHLMIYSFKDLAPWIKNTLNRLPTLLKITLDLSLASQEGRRGVEDAIRHADYASIGISVPIIVPDSVSIVLERYSSIAPQPPQEPVPKIIGLQQPRHHRIHPDNIFSLVLNPSVLLIDYIKNRFE